MLWTTLQWNVRTARIFLFIMFALKKHTIVTSTESYMYVLYVNSKITTFLSLSAHGHFFGLGSPKLQTAIFCDEPINCRNKFGLINIVSCGCLSKCAHVLTCHSMVDWYVLEMEDMLGL